MQLHDACSILPFYCKHTCTNADAVYIYVNLWYNRMESQTSTRSILSWSHAHTCTHSCLHTYYSVLQLGRKTLAIFSCSATGCYPSQYLPGVWNCQSRHSVQIRCECLAHACSSRCRPQIVSLCGNPDLDTTFCQFQRHVLFQWWCTLERDHCSTFRNVAVGLIGLDKLGR